MLHRIVAAEARPGYRLWIRFADGVEGEVDLSSLVGDGVFSSWEDPRWFSRVLVDEECGTVVWPDGVDLAPDALYRELAGVSA
jgi:hypothetical protein